ncbi:MAG: hypothetical protein M1825_004604 [Sarcosagium campestre]|nr:MAG: hypothetical protein M1825_004604 [Sarcosagium campestre]
MCRDTADRKSIDGILHNEGSSSTYRLRHYRCSDTFGKYGDCTAGISLASWLTAASSMSLDRVQRYELALRIATAQLLLRPSPWIQPDWGKSDVYFAQDHNNNLKVNQPYIKRRFNVTYNEDESSTYYRDKNAAALGIVLLEVCFGIALENVSIVPELPYPPGQTPHGSGNRDLILTTAIIWSKGVEVEAGPNFARAVSWCLDIRTVSEDKSWREKLLENVVRPLEIYLDQNVAQ